MSLFYQLDEELVWAIQNNQLEAFIADLSSGLSSQDYIRWLFLARAYDAKGDINKAINAYIHVMRIADPKNPNKTQLLTEVQKFVNRYGTLELIEVADQCFGFGSLKFPSTIKDGSLQRQNLSEASPRILRKEDENTFPQVKTGNTPPTKPIGETNISGNFENKETDPTQATGGQEDFAIAYERGDRTYSTFLGYAQILQRAKNYDGALKILNEGLKSTTGTNYLALLTLKAQILSSWQKLEAAADAFEELIAKEKREGAKRFSSIQLFQIYMRIGNILRAKEIVEEVLNRNPQDQLAIRLRSSLDASEDRPPSYTVDNSQIFQVLDITKLPPNPRSELISPMLLDDLEFSRFHDEIIIQKGEQPDFIDAERLMKQAQETKSAQYEGRYPLFLEAAKAYSKLPEGSYSLENFHLALTIYAMLKGNALVTAFLRQVDSGKADLETLKRIRDSATSYFLEALVLQARVNINQIIIQFTNYLRIQLSYALFKRGESVEKFFKLKLDDLLSFCIRHHDDNIARIAYEIVVSCGAAGEKIWRKMQDRAGGAFTGTLSDEAARKVAYKILGEMSNQEFSVQQKPKEVLQAAFFARFDQTIHLLSFFNNLRQIHLTQASLPQLYARWQEFPLYLGPLLETDIELYERVGKILDTLRRYQARTAEERTSILYTSRTSIEQLLSYIQEYPTYWGRVGFRGLLTDWQSAIQEIEQKRLEELQPKLVAQLEPPIFSFRDEHIEGGIILINAGRATADGAEIVIKLSKENGDLLYEEKESIDGEIAVNHRQPRRLSFHSDLFSEGLENPYRIDLYIAPIFHQEELGETQYSFTLEIADSGSGISSKFTTEEIPWNELDIPPKHLFKGREQFIEYLAKHLCSPERQRTYLLYGLTRTGKSTILRYLGEKIDLQPLNLKGEDYRFISFEWVLAIAANYRNAHDMWKYFIITSILEKCKTLLEAGRLEQVDMPVLRHPENVRFRDWEDIIKHFHNRKLYPVFLIDEFSYYRNLVDNRQIDASFLARIRSFAIENLASFVFAGTYDLKEFIRDPKYAVTGQLINVITEKVSRIDAEPAAELIQVMEPKLRFTPDAIEHILYLSYQIPYFIQILCRYCANFALKTGRSILGLPEVETVVQLLTGEQEDVKDLDMGVEYLSSTVFMNNLQSDSDPIEYSVLLSSICYLTADTQRQSEVPRSRMVTLPEIQELWHLRGVDSFQARLAGAIGELIEREVLIEGKDEGLPAYRISVDLFRRWWANEHSVIEREIDKLKGN